MNIEPEQTAHVPSGHGCTLMVAMRAEEKAAEERAAKPHLALIHTVGNFILGAFFVCAWLWFLAGMAYGLVLLIRKLL